VDSVATSCDHEYTDWATLEQFAYRIVADLTTTSSSTKPPIHATP